MNLIETIRDGNISDICSLIDKTPESINSHNQNGTTPLIAAIASGRRDVIEVVLKSGANPNYTSSESTLPLIFAIDASLEEDDYDEKYSELQTDIIKMLLNYGADINTIDSQERESPLVYSKGRSTAIEELFNELSNSDIK